MLTGEALRAVYYVADQVFHAPSKCFHPDLAGGDARLQRELTDARNELALTNPKG